ncbi:hypothetical protein [Pseudomonas anatoliensis]|uniref:hypothetical protein n=1 Tax=Pseudomonas anatoliensis TaxID=2710589 RepID=UPI001E3BAB78|nr:hypothetical protein [Pseudomonas anatoliensis]
MISRYRWQASSHKLIEFLQVECGQPVGASLLAMALSHSTSLSTDPPLSRASSLPQFDQISSDRKRTTCGSWLASDGGVMFNIDAG